MTGFDRINNAAENMLLSRIAKDSDFYEYIKGPAVMKVALSEVMKNAHKAEDSLANLAYTEILKNAEVKVDAIFSGRKKLYMKSQEQGVNERTIAGLSEHGNRLCKEHTEAAEKAILQLMKELLALDPEDEKKAIAFAEAVLTGLEGLEQIDRQLVSEYQQSTEQEKSGVSRNAETDKQSFTRRYRRQGNEILRVDNTYVAEYSSEISTEDLKKVPQRRRIRYVSATQEKKEEKPKKFEKNIKKMAPKVLLAMGIVTACLSLAAGIHLQNEQKRELETLQVGVSYEVEEHEATVLTNLILMGVQNPRNNYQVPNELMEGLKSERLSHEDFVDRVFEDLGYKVSFGEDLAGILEYLSENLVKYKVCEAVRSDIQRYGDESYYKKYEDELEMENFSLEYNANTRGPHYSNISLGDDILFEQGGSHYQIPQSINNILCVCRKDPNAPLKYNAYEKEDIKILYKLLNELRGKDVYISGNTLEARSLIRDKDFIRE